MISNWKLSTLGEIAHINMGQSPSSSTYNENGIGSHLIQGNADIKNRKSSPRQWTSEPTKICNVGDILMTVRAPVGAVAKSMHKACIGRGVCSINPKKVDNEFLYQYLLSYESKWKALEQGSTFTAVNGSDIKGVNIPVPPLPEQQKIADILSTVDAKIEVIDQQIIETKELKKGLMQRLLTKGIRHTEFKDSPLGEIPKSWKVVKLSDVCQKIGDGIHSTPKYVDSSEYYFVNGNNLINGTLTVSDRTKCVSKDEYEKLRIQLKVNSILMSINGTIGNLALYQNEEVIFGKSASYITANEVIINYLFLYYYLQHSNTKKYFFNELTGSTIKNLSLKTIRNTPTVLPSKMEQEKIAKILSSVDEKLDVLNDKKSHYQELKQGLMQKLLTGKVRVKIN